MKLTLTIVSVLIGLLSLAAGLAKVALVPDEVAFLGQFGLSNTMIFVFGAAQIVGGVLLLAPNTRFLGAVVAGLLFAVSSALLMVAGKLAFAAVSLLPVGLAIVVAMNQPRAQSTAADAGPED